MRCLLISLFALAGCGYHFNEEPSATSEATSENVRTLSVPYVKGDANGLFTSALIHALTESGKFSCVQKDADLVLDIALVANNTEKIGYRYERNDLKGKLRHRLMPVENRRTLVAHVTLLNGHTNDIVMEPVAVKADAEYDYVDYTSIRDLTYIPPHGKPQRSITFSLGQLDSIEGAQDDVETPLYRRLAQKIVEGLLQHE